VSELQGLQLSSEEFGRRGARVFGVVVDPVATNAELARDAGLAFPILSDPDLRTVDAYGLRHAAGHDGEDIALSASVLIDADGVAAIDALPKPSAAPAT
jgi:peroxiredoxin